MVKMVQKIIIVILFLLLCLSGIYGWFQANKVQRLESQQLDPLPEDTAYAVSVTNKEVKIQSKKEVKIIPIPKTGKKQARITKQGNIQSNKMNDIIPQACLLPQIGISLGYRIEPLIGLQILRSDLLGGLGLSFNITPSLISLSLDKDLIYPLANSTIGFQYGYTFQGYNQIALKFALYF